MCRVSTQVSLLDLHRLGRLVNRCPTFDDLICTSLEDVLPLASFQGWTPVLLTD